MRENNYTEHLFQAAGVKFQLTAAPAKTVPLPRGCAVPCQPGLRGDDALRSAQTRPPNATALL